MATYRGSKGDLTVATNSVAQIQRWRITASRPYIDNTSMGDGARKGDVDIPEFEGEMTVLLDYDDTAQAALIDAILTNDDGDPLAAEFIVSGTGPKKFTGDILPLSAAITGQRGPQSFEAQIQFNGDGALSADWT